MAAVGAQLATLAAPLLSWLYANAASPVLSVLGAATAPARAAVAAACGPTYSVFASQSGAAGVAALTAVTSLARATFALGTVVATLAALPCQYAFAKALIGAKAFAAWSVAVAAPALAAGAVKAAAFAKLAALTAAKYGSLALSIAAQKAGVLAALLGDWARLLLEQLGGPVASLKAAPRETTAAARISPLARPRRPGRERRRRVRSPPPPHRVAVKHRYCPFSFVWKFIDVLACASLVRLLRALESLVRPTRAAAHEDILSRSGVVE